MPFSNQCFDWTVISFQSFFRLLTGEKAWHFFALKFPSLQEFLFPSNTIKSGGGNWFSLEVTLFWRPDPVAKCISSNVRMRNLPHNCNWDFCSSPRNSWLWWIRQCGRRRKNIFPLLPIRLRRFFFLPDQFLIFDRKRGGKICPQGKNF